MDEGKRVPQTASGREGRLKATWWGSDRGSPKMGKREEKEKRGKLRVAELLGYDFLQPWGWICCNELQLLPTPVPSIRKGPAPPRRKTWLGMTPIKGNTALMSSKETRFCRRFHHSAPFWTQLLSYVKPFWKRG